MICFPMHRIVTYFDIIRNTTHARQDGRLPFGRYAVWLRAAQRKADHVEPCVSVKNKEREENGALNLLSCIGNIARVTSGDAKGRTGVVTGKHGGIENVLVDFEDKTLEKLAIGDKILIRGIGVGLSFVKNPHLQTLRFGDIVAIMDADHTFGRIYKTGAVSIGVIVHSNCVTAGHGPGVTTLLTSAAGKIVPCIDSTANIGAYLRIGRFREKTPRKG